MELQPNTRIGKYVVEKVLGRGGMAVVYRVRHEDLRVHYALKLLTLQAPSLEERLRREGRFQASLRHPNVVSVIDVLEVRGCPALVMEYVDGPTLAALMAVHPLTVAQVDEVAKGLLKGVRAAHAHGMFHRDLKPANVLMARTDGGFLPKIADFGLAKLARADDDDGVHTRTGALMGTPAYMAPEQFRGSREVDARADVYSLGVMLYEMLGGERPYGGEDLLEIAEVLRSGGWVPLDHLKPGLPVRMLDAVEGAMALAPADRIPDAETLYAVWCGRSERPEDRTGAFDREAVRRIEALVAAPDSPVPSLPGDEPQPARGWRPGVGGLVAFTAAASILVASTVLLCGALLALWFALSQQRVADVAPPDPPPVSPAPPPPPSPVPVPEPAAPEPVPVAAPSLGRVALTGDLRSARAITEDGRTWRLPGDLPPGTYSRMKVSFEAENGARLVWDLEGALRVVSGETSVVRCDLRMGACKPL